MCVAFAHSFAMVSGDQKGPNEDRDSDSDPEAEETENDSGSEASADFDDGNACDPGFMFEDANLDLKAGGSSPCLFFSHPFPLPDRDTPFLDSYIHPSRFPRSGIEDRRSPSGQKRAVEVACTERQR